MAYTTTTKTSYGQRLTGSFKSIGIGLILFLAASILLFKNEGNFVRKKQSLNETEAITTHVNDLSQVEESLNGTVIHATAFAHTADILTDSQFGVSTVALKLTRSVAYYQYTEKVTTIKRDKIGGGQEEVKSYTYEKKWVSAPVASEKFADPAYQASNYVLALLESETQFAANVTFDAYRLPSFMVQSIEG
ncbi:MAG: TMEM43 family protein, partial [Bacteroidetes bacterium]|nr:TMEM43 family protein [Bacteroidota bacterium]